MRALVVGSGLIGVTSAYFLACRGWEVTVLDRQDGPGRETSFANGALLTPSMAEPWNAPGSWKMLLKSLGASDSPFQLRLKALPSLMRWGTCFLWNSAPKRYQRNALNNLILALHSLEILKALRQDSEIDYGQASTGSLRVFRELAMLDRATKAAKQLQTVGLTFCRLTGEEVVALEPALTSVGDQLCGGLYYPSDEIGDAYRFCLTLAEQARRRGVVFHFETAVSAIQVSRGKVSAVRAGKQYFTADRYVLAAGSYTPGLIAPIGIRVPVRPVKGYSVTASRARKDQRLRIPIVDDHLHAVVVPLGKGIRVAGTAEFSGYDLSLPTARLSNLLSLLKAVLPQELLSEERAEFWCGLRPMSVDGVPIIGATRIENLWVNTGHGHLGWTMAAGSAQLLATLMTGESPVIDTGAYALSRFAKLP